MRSRTRLAWPAARGGSPPGRDGARRRGAGCRRPLPRPRRAARGRGGRRARLATTTWSASCASRASRTRRTSGRAERPTSSRLGTCSTGGQDGRKVLDLLMRLEGEARKAGGRVHALLGNHEVMNMLGDLRYVERGGVQDLAGAGLDEAAGALLRGTPGPGAQEGQGRGAAVRRGRLPREVPAAGPARLHRARRRPSRRRAGTARWLRERPVLAKVNGVAFLHGGLTPEVAALGCEAINAQVRRELNEDVAKTQKAPDGTLAAGEKGPLWYRGLAKDDESILAPQVDAGADAPSGPGRSWWATR